MKTNELLIILLLTSLVGGVGGCIGVGKLTEESQTVELGQAEEVELRLRMSSGELILQGGARKLMEATFLYNIKEWKPKIDYSVFGRTGTLEVRQGKRSGIPIGRTRNRWEISLNDKVPLDLVVDFGAGKGELDLRGLKLRSLDVDMGVGDLTVDLSGKQIRDLDVSIDGGVGSATIYLPEDVGVKVNVSKGIGSVSAEGLHKRESVYTNDAYGKTDISIDVEIDAGIGSIDLRLK